MSRLSFSHASVRQRLPVFLVLFFCLAGLTLGCGPDRLIGAAPGQVDQWQPWHIIETKSGRILPYTEFFTDVIRQDVVYLGEEHFNPHHIDAASRLISGLLADGVRPVIGMEMFGWDGQPALDRYLSNEGFERGAFLDQVQWKTNWGGAFENYEPLVSLARAQHLTLRAMNPPKALIRRVVKQGLAQAGKGEEWKEWGLTQTEVVDDPAYRARILDQLRRCHGGGEEADYQTMYEASMVRDEAMAKTLVTALEAVRRNERGDRTIVVSYTGGGHIQYNLPVPKRVARRFAGDLRQITVYLTSFEPARIEDIQMLVREPIADYIWLTPVSGQGPVHRCR